MSDTDDPGKWDRIIAEISATTPAKKPTAAKARSAEPVDMSRRARSARSKAAAKAADGRSARATGRTELFHFRIRPDLIDQIRKAARRDAGGNIAAWMEAAVEAAIKGGE